GAALAPGAVRVARAVTRYGGPLGDELVLPWLLAMGEGTPAGSAAGAGPAPAGAGAGAAARFDEAVAGAEALVGQAMDTTAGEALSVATQLLGRVARGDLAALGSAQPVDAAPAAAVLGGFAATAELLVAERVLAHPEQLWSLSVEEVRRLLATKEAGDWHRHRHRTLRWQSLVQQVVAVRGRPLVGEGVSPGIAAGPARRLSASRDLRRVVPGDVVVLHRPSPQLAPALWIASGLVAETGSGAAHLIEVARSLRVPAVVAVGTLEVEEGEDLVLVDGDEESVAVLPADVAGDGDGASTA
ncbi:MAG: PEP-utilizing enzyme, partial [Acidimicrobiales bacterium]